MVDVGHDGAKPKLAAARRASAAKPAAAAPLPRRRSRRRRPCRAKDGRGGTAADGRCRRRASRQPAAARQPSLPLRRRRRSRRPRHRRRGRAGKPGAASAAPRVAAAARANPPRPTASGRRPIRTAPSSSTCSSPATLLRVEFPFAVADAGRRVPPRRHAVAGVRQRRQDRSRRAQGRLQPRDPHRRARARRGRRGDRAHQAGAAAPGRASTPTARAGSSPSATPSRCRAEPLVIARSIVGKNRASIAIPFDDPRKLHRLTDRDIGDRLLVVTALGPGARLPQGAGFRRTARAAVHPRRGGAAARRRRHGGARGRQDHHQPAGRAVAVADGDRPAAARDNLPRPDLRHPALGLRPPGRVQRPAGRTDPDRRQAPASQAQAGAAQSRALLSRARHVGGGQGRARRRARRRARTPTTSPAPCSRRSPTSCSSGPRRRSRNCPIRRSATSTTRRSGARSPMRARANGRRRTTAFKNVDSAHRRAADRIAAHGAAGRAARADRGARFQRRRRASLNEFETIGVPPETRAVDRRAGRPPERRPWAATRTRSPTIASPRLRTTGRAAAQGRLREIVLRYAARRHAAQGRDRRARDAHHDLARRRDRGGRAQAARASLYRGRPLSRRLPRHAHGAAGASQFRPDPQRSRTRRR